MYTNYGASIKKLAFAMLCIGIIFSLISGLVFLFIAEYEWMIFVGILAIIAGSWISWLLYIFASAFGQLVENSDIVAGRVKLDEITGPTEKDDPTPRHAESVSSIFKSAHNMSSWKNDVDNLSLNELKNIVENEDYDIEYRVLCQREINKRLGK